MSIILKIREKHKYTSFLKNNPTEMANYYYIKKKGAQNFAPLLDKLSINCKISIMLVLVFYILTLFSHQIPLSEVGEPLQLSRCNDNIYIITSSKVFEVKNKQIEKIYTLDYRDSIKNGICYNDELLILTNRRIVSISGSQWRPLIQLPSTETGIQTIRDPWGRVFVLTDQNLFLFSGDLILYKKLKRIHPLKIAMGKFSSLIYGRDGLFFFKKNKINLLIRTVGIRDICFDKQNQKFIIAGNIKSLSNKNLFSVTNASRIICRDTPYLLFKNKIMDLQGHQILDNLDNPVDYVETENGYYLLLKNKLIIKGNKRSHKKSLLQCSYIPPFESIWKIVEKTFEQSDSAGRKWLKRSRERGYIPKISLSARISSNRGYYITKSDTISVSSYSEAVVIGPPSTTDHRDSGLDFDAGISLSWDLQKLLFSTDELSIVDRIIDINEEKRYIFEKVNSSYIRLLRLKNKCCNEGDNDACYEMRKEINLLKFFTNFNEELWRKN